MTRYLCRCLLAVLLCLSGSRAWSADGLELRKDDHICIIGNGLADRMQHSGWFEALIQAAYPQHHLVIRNLAFAGDEVVARARSENFGTPDEWLTREKADVIFGFFGYNESFQGPPGLDKFRKELDAMIKATLAKNYSGKAPARLVLFSPIAPEPLQDPNLPDPSTSRQNLELYTLAIAEAAKANGVLFVNLFPVSQQAYAQAKQPLTINGIHLNDSGYQALAPAMFQALFGRSAPTIEGAQFEKLRAAVNAKSESHFSRYRTVDGYNVYGGRSFLKFDGVMNRDEMLLEMDQRDVMTANREKRVWAIAEGGDLEVKDDNLPPGLKIKTNKPGANSDGSHVFLSGKDAISHMTVPPGCKVDLFASEERFPELANPVQMAFDTKGRLWVAAWPNYPERTPDSKQGDSLLVFEDTNGDGKADKCTAFASDLNCPTGFQFYRDGVIVVQAPDVWFLRDTDGDGKADWKERILNGMDSADSHHTANALVLDPGGAIYLSDGVFHRTQVENAWGPPVRNLDAAIYRFEPRTLKFETYIPYGFANPHGRVFDYWGNDLVTDATGNNTYFGPAISGHLDYPDKHPGIKEFWPRPSRPCPGTGILSSKHFPEEFQENYLNCNVIGFLGIYRVKVTEDGSGLKGKTIEPPLVQSDDSNFRPTAVDVAPDGSVYFLDWHNPIIGHMQHHIRDPNRDKLHGRIYRITYPSRPLTTPAAVAGQPIEKLIDLLASPENGVRTRAKIELGARDTAQVIAAVRQWAKKFDAQKLADQHALAEALWVHQWHNVVDEALLRQQLRSPEPSARAAAVRVLCYWRDRVGDSLALVRAAINDPSPRVRLEAVRAASFFTGPEAMEAAHDALKYDTDYYLDYVVQETTRQLKKSTKELFLPKDPKALSKVIDKMSNAQLLAAEATEPVLVARLERKGLDVNARNEALGALAKIRHTDRTPTLITALQRLEQSGEPGSAADLALLLTADPSDLPKHRAGLAALAATAHVPLVRMAAYAGLVAADGKPDGLWSETESKPDARAALIDSLGLLTDASMRAVFQPLLVKLVGDASAPAETRSAAFRSLPLMGPDLAEGTFALLAGVLKDGRDLSNASRAMLQLPRTAWKAEVAGPVAASILKWANQVPAADRTSQEYVETVQLGMELASFLPPAENTRIRKALLGLGVRVFSVKSVREGMRYDTTRIVVEAGKPFEIIFENVDMMPHNMAILMPGTREEVGTQAQTMQPIPDDQGRVYVPKNKNILAATKLVESGQKVTLKMTAPTAPGDYEYVCTYPEHWKVMFGQLVVVKDVDAYLEASSKTPLPAATAPGAGDGGHNNHHQHQ